MNENTYLGLVWDEVGEHFYETGVDHMALSVYNTTSKKYPAAVAWSGITAINETPTGAESNKQYADNIEYLNLFSREEYGATIEAFYYPPEFEACNGSKAVFPGVYVRQQGRSMFAFAYRSRIGNDTVGDTYGHKLHIVWGAKASPSDKSHNTINETPEAATMSWDVTTTPITFTYDDVEYTCAHMEIDSTLVDADALAALEVSIFGDATTAPADFPMPADVLEAFET